MVWYEIAEEFVLGGTIVAAVAFYAKTGNAALGAFVATAPIKELFALRNIRGGERAAVQQLRSNLLGNVAVVMSSAIATIGMMYTDSRVLIGLLAVVAWLVPAALLLRPWQ